MIEGQVLKCKPCHLLPSSWRLPIQRTPKVDRTEPASGNIHLMPFKLLFNSSPDTWRNAKSMPHSVWSAELLIGAGTQHAVGLLWWVEVSGVQRWRMVAMGRACDSCLVEFITAFCLLFITSEQRQNCLEGWGSGSIIHCSLNCKSH